MTFADSLKQERLHVAAIDYAGLVSLLELLRFYADRFSAVTRILSDMLIAIQHQEEVRRHPVLFAVTGESRRMLLKAADLRAQLDEMERILAGCDTPVSQRHIADLKARLDARGYVRVADVQGVQDTIARELNNRVFFSIPSTRQGFYSDPLTGWQEIVAVFADAQVDVEEMNKCYALSRYTAAVFHSLLVVEHGLIALGKHIGVTDPKPGWDATYNQLGRILKDRSLVPAGINFGFLEQTKARLDSMKLAWRNKVSHAAGRLAIEQSGFSDVSAEEVMVACRSFMRWIADGLH